MSDFDTIVSAVERVTKIPRADILGTCRRAPIAEARHIAVFMVRDMCRHSWAHIGALFGGRDHTSMIHAHQKISGLIRHDPNGREAKIVMAAGKVVDALIAQEPVDA